MILPTFVFLALVLVCAGIQDEEQARSEAMAHRGDAVSFADIQRLQGQSDGTGCARTAPLGPLRYQGVSPCIGETHCITEASPPCWGNSLYYRGVSPVISTGFSQERAVCPHAVRCGSVCVCTQVAAAEGRQGDCARARDHGVRHAGGGAGAHILFC